MAVSLCNLPSDIIHIIFNCLDPINKTCLAMTCLAMTHQYMNTYMSMSTYATPSIPPFVDDFLKLCHVLKHLVKCKTPIEILFLDSRSVCQFRVKMRMRIGTNEKQRQVFYNIDEYNLSKERCWRCESVPKSIERFFPHIQYLEVYARGTHSALNVYHKLESIFIPLKKQVFFRKTKN